MENKLIYYVNGKWTSGIDAQIPFNDAGFLYGDGLFETIRFENQKPFRLEKHIARLKSGCNVLQLNLDIDDSMLKSIVLEMIKKNSLKNGLIRLMVTRGMITGSPWNYTGKVGLYALIRPFSEDPKLPVKVVYYQESQYPIIRFNPAVKSMNYLGNLLAKKDAEKENAYEPVFINTDDFITECAIRNIFYIKDSTLITPSLSLGILPGVMRNTIIEIARLMKLEVLEAQIQYSEINQMSEAFISSTGIGLYPCFWDGWMSEYQITNRIRGKLMNVLRA